MRRMPNCSTRTWCLGVLCFVLGSLGPALASPLSEVNTSGNIRDVTVERQIVFEESGQARFRIQRVSPPTASFVAPQTKPVANPIVMLPKTQIKTRSISFTPAKSAYYVQLGAFRDPTNANRLKRQVSYSDTTKIHSVSGNSGVLYKVLVGPIENSKKAKTIQRHIKLKDGLEASFITTMSTRG